MTGQLSWWLLAVLTAASGLLLAALAWDLHHRLPRQLQARQVIYQAEQLCWDADFHTITQAEEQP